MSMYGKAKQAFFEDGVILETERTNHLKRFVKMRRQVEGYHGRVWFRYTDEWKQVTDKYLGKEIYR